MAEKTELEQTPLPEPAVAGKWGRWTRPMIAVYLLGAIILVWSLQAPALVPWILWGGAGYLALRLLAPRKSGLMETYLIAYGIISLFGWVICWDNLRNFGVTFGCFNDDGEYYFNMMQILDHGKFRGAGVYEMILAGIGWGYRHLGVKDIAMAYLLPFNFMLAAWCVGLTGVLARLVTGRAIPLFLLLVCTVGNFYFIEATARFYRDSMVMVLMVGAICLLAAKKPVRGVACAIAAGLFRGANGIVALMFGMVYVFKRWVNYTLHFWLLTIALTVVAVVAIRLIPFCFFSVVGDQTKTGLYINQMERQNTYWQLLNRRKALARYFPPNSIARKAYALGGLTGNGLLLGSTVFYPLTVRGPTDSMPVANRYILDTYITDGQFFYNIMKWGFTLSWLIVAPLLVCGVIMACRGSHLAVTTAFMYIVLVVGVTLISMQQRHVCAFVVLHPALAALGYYLSENDRFMIKLRKWLFIIVPAGIILWNILRYQMLR